MKQRQAAFLWRGLHVVFASLECGAGFGGQSRRVAGVLDLVSKQVGDERLGGRVGGIEYHEPAGAEHLLEPSGERVGHPRARRVDSAKAIEHDRGELGGG